MKRLNKWFNLPVTSALMILSMLATKAISDREDAFSSWTTTIVFSIVSLITLLLVIRLFYLSIKTLRDNKN